MFGTWWGTEGARKEGGAWWDKFRVECSVAALCEDIIDEASGRGREQVDHERCSRRSIRCSIAISKSTFWTYSNSWSRLFTSIWGHMATYAHLVFIWWKYWACFGENRTICFCSSQALVYKDPTSSNVSSLSKPSRTNVLGWYCPRLPSPIETFETNVCIKEAYASITGILGTRSRCWTRTAQSTIMSAKAPTSHGKPTYSSGKGHWARIDDSSSPCSLRRI